MAEVGDRVQVPSKRVGQAPRDGVVVAVSGGLLRIEWSGGEESTLTPSMGSLVVVGRVRGRAQKGGSTATPARAVPEKVAAKKAVAKKAVAKKAVAKKAVAKKAVAKKAVAKKAAPAPVKGSGKGSGKGSRRSKGVGAGRAKTSSKKTGGGKRRK